MAHRAEGPHAEDRPAKSQPDALSKRNADPDPGERPRTHTDAYAIDTRPSKTRFGERALYHPEHVLGVAAGLLVGKRDHGDAVFDQRHRAASRCRLDAEDSHGRGRTTEVAQKPAMA